MKKRGQASVEYLILVGVMLAFLIPLFYYALTEISSNLKTSQAENTIDLLTGKIDNVYSLGPGNREKVKITIPKGTVSLEILENKTVELKLMVYGNITEIFKKTKANIIANLPKEQGTYFFIIESLDNGDVKIDIKK